MNRFSALATRGRSLSYAIVIASALASAAPANQIVFIDFDGESPKGDKKLFDPTDKTKKFATLKEGAGMPFDVTKIGFAAADANAVKDAIVNQVKADFPAATGLNFKNSKDHNLADFAGQKVTVLDVVSGKDMIMVEVEIGGAKHTITRGGVGGISEKIDTENMDKMDAGWILADPHNLFADKNKNRIEVGNTISHELGHLLGLEHKHGSAGSIMGPDTDGADRDFKKGETDVLKKAMCYEAPMEKQQKSKRLRWGDFDFGGAADRWKPETPIYASATDAEKLKTAGDMVDYMSAPDVRFKQFAAEWALTEPDDALGTDQLLSGQLVRLPLPSNMFMSPGLARSIFFEIGHYNLVDEPGNPSDDLQITLLVYEQGSSSPISMPLPNFLEGLDGGGGDATDPAMGLYDESAWQILDPSTFGLLASAAMAGGTIEVQIRVPSTQHVGIDYAGFEVLFVPEPHSLWLAASALAGAFRRRNYG